MPISPVAPLMLVPIAALGLVFGSFVTALSYRLPRGESIAHGRSRCPHCTHVLEAPDLVPLLSWLAHRGKCRHCGVKISGRYPFIELMTLVLFVAAGLWAVNVVQLGLLLAMTPVMMALAVIDLEHRRLPNVLVLVLAVLALAWRWHADQAILTGVATAAVAVGVGLLLDGGFRKVTGTSGLGVGDTKLFAVAALALPVPAFLLFAVVAASLGVVFGLLWRWRTHSGSFPFAPAILAGFFWALLAAEWVMGWVVDWRLG
jgi:leader peptidase (prepilin peptidase) / N-methyltransferase